MWLTLARIPRSALDHSRASIEPGSPWNCSQGRLMTEHLSLRPIDDQAFPSAQGGTCHGARVVV